MTDVSTSETPIELVPPVPLEIPPDAGAAREVETPVSVELDAAPSSAEAPAERALPDGIEHLGVLRRSVLDHLLDTVDAGPQSVSAILAAMPAGTTRGNVESAVKRNFDAGLVERVGAGLYTLAKPKPPEAKPKPAPPPEPVRTDGTTDEQFFALLDTWTASGRWEGPGNLPGEAGCLVPPGVVSRHNDRIRKRLERQRDREAAQARQSAADTELRTKLLHACHQNYAPSLEVDDLAPIREVLKTLPIVARSTLTSGVGAQPPSQTETP